VVPSSRNKPLGKFSDQLVGRDPETKSGLGPKAVVIATSAASRPGTSSFIIADLKERPDLTPWLASVFVIPAARRRGHVIQLIKAA
jgi:hypothetical protein